MAIFHLTTKIHGRTQSTKLNAVRALAYRNGMCIKDPNTGKYYNSSLKAPEVIFTKQYLPDNAPAWMENSIKLWARVEKLEKRPDAQIFRELEGSFPIELGPEEWQEILDAYVKENFTDLGMAFSGAIHNKPGNPHFHGMATLRSIEGDDFGNKNREWNRIALVYKFRQSWEKHVNAALEKYGFDARISCKSYKDLEIDKVPTVHVPPEYKPKRGKVYTQKREAAIQHNEYVQHINSEKAQAAKQAKISKVRTDLLAGHHCASLIKFLNPGSGYNTPPVDPPIDTDNNSVNSTISLDSTTDINNGIDIVIINAPPIVSTPELSPDEIAIRSKMREAIPNADELFNELGRVRTGLGRTWNWGTFESQYERIDKSKPDLLDAFLVKELVWIFSKKPELASTYTSLVAPIHLRKSAQSVKSFAQFGNPDAISELDKMIEAANKQLNPSPVLPLTALPVAVVEAPIPHPTLTYEQALGSLKDIVLDIDLLVSQFENMAKAGGRSFSPEILSERIKRIEKLEKQPELQSNLTKWLITRELIFLVKKKQAKLPDVLNTIPSEGRAFYESFIADYASKNNISLSLNIENSFLITTQMDIQAEKAIMLSCSEFDIKDYHARFKAMSKIGITYSWTDFKNDIQRFCDMKVEHARSWWAEKFDSLKSKKLDIFREHVPRWFTDPKPPAVSPLPISYPLATWNEKPQNELIMRAMASLAPSKKYKLEANDITLSVDTLEEIAEYGVEHQISTGDVTALRIQYFHKAGFAEWESELKKAISNMGMYGHGESKQWLREQFEFRDPTDVAAMLRAQMDAQTFQGDLVPAPSPIYSNTPFVKSPEPKLWIQPKPDDTD